MSLTSDCGSLASGDLAHSARLAGAAVAAASWCTPGGRGHRWRRLVQADGWLVCRHSLAGNRRPAAAQAAQAAHAPGPQACVPVRGACLGVEGPLRGFIANQHKLLWVEREAGAGEVGGATHRDAVAVHWAHIGWGCLDCRGAQQRHQHCN